MPLSQGPYLSFAVLCEKVLRETDDVLSLIRVVDRVAVDPPPPLPTNAAPLDAIPVVSLTLAIALKSGGYVGSAQIKVRPETPSGSTGPEFSTTANMTGEDRGVAVVIPLQLPAQDLGLYWFSIEVLGEVLTRVPLRITRQDATPPQRG